MSTLVKILRRLFISCLPRRSVHTVFASFDKAENCVLPSLRMLLAFEAPILECLVVSFTPTAFLVNIFRRQLFACWFTLGLFHFRNWFLLSTLTVILSSSNCLQQIQGALLRGNDF